MGHPTKNFLPGQSVRYRDQVGVVEAVDLTPGMVDVRYGRLVKRHRWQDLGSVSVAKNNSGRTPRRERLARTSDPSRGHVRRNPTDTGRTPEEGLQEIVQQEALLRTRLEKLHAQVEMGDAELSALEERLRIAKAAFEAVGASERRTPRGQAVESTYDAERAAFHLKQRNLFDMKTEFAQTLSRYHPLEAILRAPGGDAARAQLAHTYLQSFTKFEAKQQQEQQTSDRMALGHKKPRPSVPIRTGTGPGPSSQFYTAAAFRDTVQEGATWLVLPDPPRFVTKAGALEPEICGNPIDGAMYVLILKGAKRYAPITVTDTIWGEAIQSWTSVSPKEPGSAEEVLTAWARNKKNFGIPVVHGDHWEEGAIVPFSAEQVRVIKSGATLHAAAKTRQRTGQGKMRGGDLYHSQVDASTHFFETYPDSGEYVYLVYPRAASVNEEKLLESFTPPFNKNSGKKFSPLFTWSRMYRPLSVAPPRHLRSRGRATLHATPGGDVITELPPQSVLTILQGRDEDRWIQVKTASDKTGWVSKANVTYSGSNEFSRPPLCESEGSREITKAARETKNRISQMLSNLRWLRTAIEKGVQDESYSEKSIEQAGSSFLRSLAWFASWCQDMAITQERLPEAVFPDVPELLVFSAIRKDAQVRPGGLDVSMLVKLASSSPLPLVDPDPQRLARILGRTLTERAMGQTPPSFISTAFLDPNSSPTAPAGIVNKLRSHLLQEGKASSSQRAAVLVSTILQKLQKSGAVLPQDSRSLKEQLEQQTLLLFFDRKRELEVEEAQKRKDESILTSARAENARLSMLRALFFLYYSMGGPSTERMLSAAIKSLDLIVYNAGRLPRPSYAAVEAQRSLMQDALGRAKDQREEIQKQLERLEAESRLSQIGASFSNKLGENIRVFYTFNPLLFSLTKDMWGTESPWTVNKDGTVSRDTMVRLRDIDVIGRYGYALKLFYEHGLSKEAFEDTQRSLAHAVQAKSFKAWLNTKIDATPTVSANDLSTWGAQVERSYPVLSKLEPGFGGAENFMPAGEDETRAGWVVESGDPNFMPEGEKFVRSPSTYLSDLRASSFDSMSRQRALLHKTHPGREAMRPLSIAASPPHSREPLVGETGAVPTHLPPGSSVAALEDLERDFHNLRDVIKRRRQELLALTARPRS